MSSFPVDSIIPDFLEALRRSPAVVVQAPPGAGKTTRLPLRLLQDSRFADCRIVMLEPRRLAAVNAACYMAATLGDRPGGTVGYATRFERRVGPETRLEVVTEGILTRRLQSDPLLTGVDIVVFDEFHERNLNSDLALTLCRDVQKGLRDDLKIVVMSATLDAASVASFLGEAPVLTSEGRAYPVDIRYLQRDPEGNVADVTAAAVRRALPETDGDILVFLPGAGEIGRCVSALADLAPTITVCPLYADLPFDAQERAIRPGTQRKVVLATTIAETSLTIEGVKVVIDCGWTRQSRFDPSRGLEGLVTVRVSRASADQRAGRAGRTAPGVCYRLWSPHVQSALVPFNPPEIFTADLAGLALDLASWGIQDAAALGWLDAPPAAHLAKARELLQQLGALDDRAMITATGRDMARYPLHPRLGRMMVEAEKTGSAGLACDIAAILSERDMLRNDDGSHVSGCDISDRLTLLDRFRRKELPAGAGAGACRAVDRLARLLRQRVGADAKAEVILAHTIERLLCSAFPDRIGKRREAGGDRYLLASGRGATLSRWTHVGNPEYLVAPLIEMRSGADSLIRMATSLSVDTIEEVHVSVIRNRRTVEWDRREGRVVARDERVLGAVVLTYVPAVPSEPEAVTALLKAVSGERGVGALSWTPAARQFQARVLFLRRLFPEEGWPDLSDHSLGATLEEWLAPWLPRMKSMKDVEKLDVLTVLKGFVDHRHQRILDEDAPSTVSVPSGSTIRVDYTSGDVPVLAVKLQELFGLPESPRVGRGTVPVLIHLLSPAGRPVQVTTDLRNFWNNGYQQVKKELKGRYPKHPWPDDPWAAVPTRGVKRK